MVMSEHRALNHAGRAGFAPVDPVFSLEPR